MPFFRRSRTLAGMHQQRCGAGLQSRHSVDPLQRRQRGPARFVCLRVEAERGHWVVAPGSGQARLETVGGKRARPLGGDAGNVHRQHVAQGAVAWKSKSTPPASVVTCF